MAIAFLIMFVGCLSAYRMCQFFVESKIILKSTLPKIGTIYFFYLIAAVLVVNHSYMVLWIVNFLPHLVFLAVVAVLKVHRESRFREGVGEIMNKLILKMKIGKSLRHAMSELLSELDPHMRQKMAEIFDFVVFSQQNHFKPTNFVSLLISELRKVDQEPHAAIRRLIRFRDRLQIEDNFRRRSGQVIQQIRIQSILITGIYLAVLVFVGHEFGFRQNVQAILLSTSLFACGFLWIFLGGRKMRWKV